MKAMIVIVIQTITTKACLTKTLNWLLKKKQKKKWRCCVVRALMATRTVVAPRGGRSRWLA